MRPGGNFTQPHYDPETEITTFQVFVAWKKVDEKESDADAVAALREHCGNKPFDLGLRLAK